MIKNIATKELNPNFPHYKWREMPKKDKKHLKFKSEVGEIKGFQYIEKMTERLKQATKDISQPGRQLYDPQTSQRFNHSERVRVCYYAEGLIGVNKYIDHVNKSLELIYDEAIKLSAELKNMQQ